MQIVKEPPTEKEKVRLFIHYYKRPFSTNDIRQSTGVKINSIREYVRQFIAQGMLKGIKCEGQKKIYVKNNSPRPSLKKRGRNMDFGNERKITQMKKYERLKEVYQECTDKTCSELVSKLDIPRSTLKTYLNTLYAAGLIMIIDPICSKAVKYRKTGETFRIDEIPLYRRVLKIVKSKRISEEGVLRC